jgi:hypothetical protein
MVAMEIPTALVTITLPVMATVLLGNRQTQRIIQASNRQTQRILREIKSVQQNMQKCLLKMARVQKDMHKCLLKLDFGFKANAAMHGWARVDGVAPAQARKLPEPKVYDPELRICYYRAS